MKRILSALFALILSFGALAQYATITHSNPGGIVWVADSGTSNVISALSLDCRKEANVGLLLSMKLAGAGTGNVTLTFRPTIDSASTPTHTGNNITWVVAANGTTTVLASTNFAVTGYGYLNLVSIANAGGDVLTNLSLTYSLKRVN